MLYIKTLGISSHFRNHGIGNEYLICIANDYFIGSLILEHLLYHAKSNLDVSLAELHVQVSNTKALEFYKKHGFTVKAKIENYYRRANPAAAHLLSRTLE